MWWPTPADPGRWFEASEIVASRNGVQRIRWVSRPGAPVGSLLADQRLNELARSFGLDEVEFVVVAGDEINASSSGNKVIFNKATLRQPVVIREWLAAHELAHLRLGHSRKLLLLATALTLIVASVLVWFHVLAGVIAGLVLFLGHRWTSRAFERQADITALGVVARPDMRDLTELALRSSDDLAPSVLRRLVRRHPAPAERLELLSRL